MKIRMQDSKVARRAAGMLLDSVLDVV